MIAVVTVFKCPGCGPCVATVRWLQSHGVAYEAVDVADPAAEARVMSLGYRQVPVVVAGDEHWSGFRPERPASLVEAAA